MLSPLVAAALDVLASPPRALYACAGLPREVDWRGLARANPARREFIAQAAASSVEFLRSAGWRIGSGDG
jgi:hypothetical protein